MPPKRRLRPGLLAALALAGLGLLAAAPEAAASPITLSVTGTFRYGCGVSGCLPGTLSGQYTYDPAGPVVIGPWGFRVSDEDGGPAAGNGMGNPADGNPLSPCAAMGTCQSFVVLSGDDAHFSQGWDSALGFVDGWVNLTLGAGPGTGSFFDIVAPAPVGPGHGPYTYDFAYVATPVPEPAAWLLLLTGLSLLGLGTWLHRRLWA